MRSSGPYRADQVGSLLRPAAVREARVEHAAGRLSRAELNVIEDQAIRDAVAHQERIGLKAVTDGEFRRGSWALDFFAGLEGTRLEQMATAPVAHGGATQASRVREVARVVDKVSLGEHPMIAHFRFLKSVTKMAPKITVPAPTMIVSASRDWREVVDRSAYPDLESFFHDMGRVYRDLVQVLYAEGCRYLQLDDVNMSYLCDADMRAGIVARGDDPEEMLRSWVKLLDSVVSTRPSDMTITTHVCRGNFRSSWFAQGGYEPVADALFNEIDYDGYFLEYDSERAGGFEPLSLLPKGDKRVVLGLMTTKTGVVEDGNLIKSRVDAATQFVPLEQLCLSPQCGFASTEEGNLLSEDDQWSKLERVAELAREIWTDA